LVEDLSTLKMEAGESSKPLAIFYQTAWCALKVKKVGVSEKYYLFTEQHRVTSQKSTIFTDDDDDNNNNNNDDNNNKPHTLTYQLILCFS